MPISCTIIYSLFVVMKTVLQITKKPAGRAKKYFILFIILKSCLYQIFTIITRFVHEI